MNEEYQSGIGFVFKVDVDAISEAPSGTADFQAVNAISADLSFGETVDTFKRLIATDGGYSTNVVTGLDPSFSLVYKYDKNNPADVAIYNLRNSTNRKVPCEITDSVTGETIEFTGEATAISDSRTIETVIEVNVEFKLRGMPLIIPPVVAKSSTSTK